MRWLVVVLVALVALPVSVAEAAGRTDGSTPAPATIAQLVTNVPVGTLNQVGAGAVYGPNGWGVFKLRGHLTSEGKPEVLTMNLAWCPHCAANSWALAVALSRFGTLTGLRTIDTGTHYCTLSHAPCNLAPFPCYPHTNGLSFLDASYQSPYVSLKTVVFQDVRGRNLERPTRPEIRAMNSFDPQGQTPALDVGGAYGFAGSGYNPAALAHKTGAQIAGSLADPHSPIARHVDGLANVFTAAICKVTKGRPADVCESGGVLAARRSHLVHASPPLTGPPGPPPGP